MTAPKLVGIATMITWLYSHSLFLRNRVWKVLPSSSLQADFFTIVVVFVDGDAQKISKQTFDVQVGIALEESRLPASYLEHEASSAFGTSAQVGNF